MTPVEQLVSVVGDTIRVDADLRMEIDGRPVRLDGSGQRLLLHVEDAADLRRFGAGPGDAGVLREFASGLDQLGLTLEVRSPRGRVATVGADAAQSRLARATGTPVQPGREALRVAPAAIGAVAAAIVAVLVWLRGRGDHHTG